MNQIPSSSSSMIPSLTHILTHPLPALPLLPNPAPCPPPPRLLPSSPPKLRRPPPLVPLPLPPPLVLSSAVDPPPETWGPQERRAYFRKRLRRGRLGIKVPPLLAVAGPNLVLVLALSGLKKHACDQSLFSPPPFSSSSSSSSSSPPPSPYGDDDGWMMMMKENATGN